MARSHIARDHQKLLRPVVHIAHRGDRDIVPTPLAGAHMAQSLEPSHLPRHRRSQDALRRAPRFAGPCLHPQHAFHRPHPDLLDPSPHRRIDHLAAAGGVEQRHAIRAALDHPRRQFLGLPRPLLRLHALAQGPPYQHKRKSERPPIGHDPEDRHHHGQPRLRVPDSEPDHDRSHDKENDQGGRDSNAKL